MNFDSIEGLTGKDIEALYEELFISAQCSCNGSSHGTNGCHVNCNPAGSACDPCCRAIGLHTVGHSWGDFAQNHGICCNTQAIHCLR